MSYAYKPSNLIVLIYTMLQRLGTSRMPLPEGDSLDPREHQVRVQFEALL